MAIKSPTQAEALLALAAAIDRNTEVVRSLSSFGDLSGEVKNLREKLEQWPRMTAAALGHARNAGEKTRVAMEAHFEERGRQLARAEKRILEAAG